MRIKARRNLFLSVATVGLLGLSTVPSQVEAAAYCERTISADVVALDQALFYNRFGAVNPHGMMYALRRDVEDINGLSLSNGGAAVPGQVSLRQTKRPRPMVLRMNVGDCLTIYFQNLLAPDRDGDEQPATRTASIHVLGMQLVDSIEDDGSYVGKNPSSLVAPGESAIYTLYGEREGGYLLYSTAAQTGGEGGAASLAGGLFGAINVEPKGAEYYRSQLTQAEMFAAADKNGNGYLDDYEKVPTGQPKINYDLIAMLVNGEIVHSDLTAIITGPNRGNFKHGTYPLNPVIEPNVDKPQANSYNNPDDLPLKEERPREEPFREFTSIFHDEIAVTQAFGPEFFDNPDWESTLHSVRDGFAINYGSGGIGAEIIANRVGVGPAWDCVGCKYEEFFLTSWALGDPAMVVDVAADESFRAGRDENGDLVLRAAKAFYPSDPSNVNHSYIGDHTKFRNIHAGPKEHHIFHLHAHQWLFTPDSDNSAYLDSQAIGPGSSYTYEINYNGAGNRNQVVGDSIYHCHFYPHFAMGMWYLWRTHDVFEAGTKLDDDGRPAPGSRAYPDGEILAGTPIPAIVPIPTLAMPPMPGAVASVAQDPSNPGTSQIQINGKFLREMTDADYYGYDGIEGTADDLGNPGYPFFVPATAGRRPPQPVLDTEWDGGLPRHILGTGEALSTVTPLDFTKELESVEAFEIAEDGEPVELAAMAYHAKRTHDSYTPEGDRLAFITNGNPPMPGAPYAEPCIDDQGNRVGSDRAYRAAYIQLDIVLNKVGDHFPQSRILTLWDDVAPTLAGTRAPEPLFFRANTDDCLTFYGTNLVPNVYEMDDYQVRTPTDVMGQHIHLVKFDVTSSDGSTNGWNYEDGVFSPDEVRERIRAIRAHNSCDGDAVNGGDWRDGKFECPVALPHPYFGAGPGGAWVGAQTKVQRWYVDDVLNNLGDDRTLRTIFTHDHYGPSTHQQAGLYASLVIEPAGSSWRNPETGEIMGSRFDGGPTSWRADILAGDIDGDGADDSYREFMFQFADFQLAYKKGSHPDLPVGGGPVLALPYTVADFAKGGRAPGEGYDVPLDVINPPARDEAGLPHLVKRAVICPNGTPLPCPEAIAADDVGGFSVNYRNEPLAHRVVDLTDPLNPKQAPGPAGDLSQAFRSDIVRANPVLNTPASAWPYGANQSQTVGSQAGDPFTPLLRVYEGDPVQIRVQVGATEEGHTMTVHGLKWLQEPSDSNSGWRNAQMIGISEHFEFLDITNLSVESIRKKKNEDRARGVDYLWQLDASSDGLWNGLWGLMRAYEDQQDDLLPLPSNPDAKPAKFVNKKEFANNGCPRDKDIVIRKYNVVAARASDLLGPQGVVYNSRTGAYAGNPGPLQDPWGLMYVMKEDLDRKGKLKSNAPVEPLILRANAGDCIQVTLENRLPFQLLSGPPGYNGLPMIIDLFNANDLEPSHNVGLHPQLVAYDMRQFNGVEAGFNAADYGDTTVKPGQSKTYTWYAGDITVCYNGGPVAGCNGKDDGYRLATPIEFGAINLMPSDPIEHSSKGLIGALIIEPEGSIWATDAGTRAAAWIDPDGSNGNAKPFREFVVLFQDDIQLRDANGVAICPVRGQGEVGGGSCFGAEDAEDSGNKAVNYRTEPMWFRMGYSPGADLGTTNEIDYTEAMSNVITGGADPETPVFTAPVGTEVRFRLLQPGGHPRNHVFQVHGHTWQREPYVNDSTEIGDNPYSQWMSAQEGMGPANHFDVVLENGAGGAFGVLGDYLWRDQAAFQFDGGTWGLFRVEDPKDGGLGK